MPYYAHKEGKRFYLLSAHLAKTAAGAAARLQASPRREELTEAALLAGLAHDFGKYTPFFQRYLRTGRGGPEKQHAFLSALWAAHLAEEFGMAPLPSLALFIAICQHHRHLADPEEILLPPRELSSPSWDHLEPVHSERLKITQRQIEALCQKAESVARSLKVAARHTARLLEQNNRPVPAWLDGDWPRLLERFFDNWIHPYGHLYRHRRRQTRNMRDSAALQDYFDLLALFSAVIDADKIHSARLKDTERALLPPQPVQAYRDDQFGPPRTAADRMREDLYNTVCRTIKEAPLSQKLFTITAPTGSGKTLAGLAAAFILREKMSGSVSEKPRIIYALPFTSIVDQTYRVAKKVLQAGSEAEENGASIPSAWLLKHHHLAETAYHRAGDEEETLSLDRALLLIESWQSEIIITTFVQLLHTLIASENRMLKKFHRLQNAILILDEVQNIPVEYWSLVENALRGACNYLGARVLLMTATRPEWFEEGEALELAGPEAHLRKRFATLNRVIVTANPQPLTVEELAEAFTRSYHPERSYLVILNTIKSSIAFYGLLKEKVGLNELYYLSTNITPRERAARLQQLEKLLKCREKPVLVSTQVVEAGVDLDFDEVWRDLGPIDAVVQAAGRCNRHFLRDRGQVRVWQLVDRNEKGEATLAQYVYGKIHTHAAKKMFGQEIPLQEKDFYDAVANYFEEIRQAKSAAASKALLEAMQYWRFSPRDRESELLGVANFALIKNRPHYVNVFVELDDTAAETWQIYQSTVVNEKDFWKRRRAFLSIKKDFSSYLLSVPAQLLAGRLDETSAPMHIPGDMLEHFYDSETGFKRIDDETMFMF
ncbi:MAG: CRISPR-associated helicase Cas3' [Dethiobacteria bacterium]